MASKRVPDLTLLTKPDYDDSIVVYDKSADITKRTSFDEMYGINGLLYKVLLANDTGTNVSTAQPWFPTAGAVTVKAGTLYAFEGTLRTSRAAGTTSHTTSLLFGGTASLTSIVYQAVVNTGDVVTNLAANQTASEVATATVVKAASTSATEQTVISVRGVVRVNNAGTFIPQFQYSAIPGGVPTILANSNFRMYILGTSSDVSKGTWS